MTDLQKTYKEEAVVKLQKKLNVKNPMSVPKLSKIVVNMGVKDAVADKKNVEKMSVVLSQITGQKVKTTRAKKAIASFKLRIGDPIGLVATLRGERMYDFYDKIVKIVLPRIKDFRGVRRTSFDKSGNYTLGLHEYSVFPEIDPGSVERLQGMEIVIVTTADNTNDAIALLEELGMPFTKDLPAGRQEKLKSN
ncbi:MAG TPA: 50S ribosomal protein L5 [Xanthomonadales bacterium]|nr:50S ribosomal protein L5 [Xanthomonadales bacterium]